MQCFIGGAYAGKRAAVRARFDNPVWLTAYAGDDLETWPQRAIPGTTLVVEGWERWLATALDETEDDDRLRRRFADTLAALARAEREHGLLVVLIVLEMGRGIVPLDAGERRLRDLAGWLAQDAASMAERVWYVWNGLVQGMR
ncbi:bifunctional adenosylcobinamide kinase/adenosylcobinamide-phosphate guanylyltransferase [Halomonas sp. McH1-25]|uniref:bifunctional adenosylcobinamide kinase/adenosylcobinamide-phosphate guanylyltransferase n=1 Tax=unclassified Halomonas TaxID=2609666 RepID=UPI001EF4ADCB|nr:MULTISPECIES: bifunctional adenosylcobinamide kinase/adenosylcobinamide-phosphate guanylyltransferase [unclassified Halomonas]MCG7599890.1 bifunctional adenosylcobinamide kinase/adenosylcobinamide-phosphate guanylyltransferase [Halomonas sp. McH1-25]MCP1344766.1 bifunctional adenosylcobinamide kinase/adenosylcobinamide-phosphate guanylyltransferase [Halomonas sp. FL8]MCP1362884.1 bifunctional adenosylcobinamide kinase/adenosylcobinamide-phosphate guanylyltransferase [Halomonas sp. BBD45]MCP1